MRLPAIWLSLFILPVFVFPQKTNTTVVKKGSAVSIASNLQPKQKGKELNDFICSLHEETINKVLDAVGEIKGSSTYEVLLINGNYHYTIKNSQIHVRPDSSNFTCDALVQVGPFDYNTKVIGDVKIAYDNDSNVIFIRITRAVFELYTRLLGNKIHIKDIHLEDHFKEPFRFEGPRTMSSEFQFMMPDSTIKKIYIAPTECRMQLKYKEICTSCEIAAAEVKKQAIIKVIPPIKDNRSPGTTTVGPPGKK